MGTMDLSELRDATRWALDNKQNLTKAQLDRWINWTYLHVSMPRIYKHRGLQFSQDATLVTDQVTYDLHTLFAPAVLWGIHSVVYVEGSASSDYSVRRRRLRQTDIRFVDEQVLGQGEPTEYAIYGGGTNGGHTLFMNHRPGSNEAGNVVLIRGWQAPTKLSLSSDTTVLHELFDEAIVVGATWRGWRELARPERSEPARLNFGALMNEIQSVEALDAEDWGTRMEVDLTPYQVGAGGTTWS